MGSLSIGDALPGLTGGSFFGFGAGLLGSGFQAWSNKQLQEDQWAEQEHMFKHRYQWTMEDMRRAGLNPMLAYMQGPGSPGSAGTASVPGNIGTDAINSALAVRRAQSENKLLEYQAENVAQDTTKKFHEAMSAQNMAAKLSRENQIMDLLDIPAAKNLGAVEKTPFGEGMPYAERALRLVPFLGGGAKSPRSWRQFDHHK